MSSRPGELAELIEQIRGDAFDARCNAARANGPESRRLWTEIAAQCDQVIEEYESLYRRSLN